MQSAEVNIKMKYRKICQEVIEEEIPSPEEKKKMDKEFKIWSIVVACAVVIVLVAYVIPFLIG